MAIAGMLIGNSHHVLSFKSLDYGLKEREVEDRGMEIYGKQSLRESLTTEVGRE